MKLLLLLVAAVAALQSPYLLGKFVTVGQQYTFQYEGRIISGLPVSDSDNAMTRISSLVTLQVLSDRSAALQLKNIRIFSSPSKNTESLLENDLLEERELSTRQQKVLELPLRFFFENGVISHLEFASEEENWSSNIKKSIVNMLQMNTQKVSEDELLTKEVSVKNNFNSIIEKTIEGECEVIYTVVPEDKETTLVTKTINFDKCSKRPDFYYNTRFLSKCEDCQDIKTITPQTVYNYKLEENELKEVEVRSVYNVQQFQTTILTTEVRSRLVLKESSAINSEIELTSEIKKEDLIYSNEWDTKVEEFFKNGDKQDNVIFGELTNKVEIIKKLVDEIIANQQTSEESSHLLARVTRLLRLCSTAEVEKLHHHFIKADNKQKDLIHSALAIAGTKNTIEHLLRNIESRSISPLKAALLFKSIQETMYPSEKIAHLIHKFTTGSVCEKDQTLRQSAWLAYGAVVRGILENNEKHLIHEESKELKHKFMSVLHKQLKNADTVYEKVLAIKTIANSGLDIAVQHLERVIYDKQEQKVVRMEAVDALRHLTEQMPRKIQRLLMPIYSSRQHPVELRMASLVKILDCKPEASLLSQIVNRMERETNEQVATFTYYMLTTLAKSESPVHKRVASDISTLLRQTRYQPEKRLLSHYIHFPLFSENIFSGVNFNMATLFGKNSPFPTEVMASLETVFGKNWSKYLGQMGFTQQNLEQIFSMVLNKLNRLEKTERHSAPSRAHRITPAVAMIKEVARKLNIKTRSIEKEEPYTMLYFRFKNMDFAVIPLDEKVLDNVVEKYVQEGSVDMDVIRRLFNINEEFEYLFTSFVYENTYKFPTSIGFPLTFSGKIPTVASFKGKLTVEKVAYGLRLRIRAEPTIVATHVYEMRFWSPILEQGVKILHSVHTNAPIDMDIEATMIPKYEIVIKSLVPQSEKTLIRVTSRPVAYVRMMSMKSMDKYVEAEQKTISLPRWEQLTSEFDKVIEVSGMKFIVHGNQFVEKNHKNMLLGEQQLEILYVPTSRVPKDLKLRFLLEPILERNIDLPKMDMLLEEELETEDYEYDRRDEKSRREEGQKMIRELNEKQGYKQRMSFSVEVESEKKAEMEVRYEWLNDLRFARFVVEAKRNALEYENREWTLKTNVEMLLPKEPKTLKELKEQKHREIQINFESRWGSEKKNTLNMKVQLEQSKEHRRWIRLAEKELRGMSSYELLLKAARLNQVKIVTKYDLTPASEMVLSRVYDLIKSYSLFSHSVERKMDSENTRRALTTFTIDSYTQRLFNLTIETPREILRLENVVIPSYWIRLPTIARVPSSDKIFTPRAECQIKSNKMITFDDVIYRAPLTTCYSVVAKDCSETPRFVVKVKKVSENSEKKVLRVLHSEDEYIVELVEDKIKVTKNNKVIREDDYINKRMELLGEKLIVLNLQHVIVKFDGYTVKVNVDQEYKNVQCGLCGHYDGERSNDFRTAEDEETTDIEKFHRSFLVNDKDCKIEEEKLSDKKNYQITEITSDEDMYDEEPEYYSEVRKVAKKEREEYDESEEKSEIVPEKKIRIHESSHRLCFSVEPVNICPKNTQQLETVEEKIRFTCVERHSAEARPLLRSARLNEIREFRGLPVSFVGKIDVPKMCKAF